MDIRKVLFWVGVGILSLYVVLVLARIPHVREAETTEELVAEIHATKLTMADVIGEDLPPDPGEEAIATVAGVDANENGIRDDVELAIFEKYPDSAKTRAALLQYALALQMQFTQPIVNTDVVVAAIKEEDRAYLCFTDAVLEDDVNELRLFVKDKQINTPDRTSTRSTFYSYVDSYSSLDRDCDIDYSSLIN